GKREVGAMAHIQVVATPDEYREWLMKQQPDMWRDWLWTTQPFDAGGYDHDPIADFLYHELGVDGHTTLSDDKDCPHVLFRVYDDDHSYFTMRLPDWMLPLVCRYHRDERKVSKEQ